MKIFISLLQTAFVSFTVSLPLVGLGQSATTQARIPLSKAIVVNDSHLIIPVANHPRNESEAFIRLGMYEGNRLIQDMNVSLPKTGDDFWLAAYPLKHFNVAGKTLTIQPADGQPLPVGYRQAFDLMRGGSGFPGSERDDYAKPYRNQFHASTRRGWNNDPNGLVYHNGKYHLYYQHNPFGIFWGNMHWGHFTSVDLIHWEEQPITLYQKTVKDMAFSGGGFVDFNNSAGLGANTQFAAFTSTGRGECLAYSKDGGMTFTELPENPVVTHQGRDPKIIWYEPEQKWVMVLYNAEECEATRSVPPAPDSDSRRALANIAFYESKNLREWTRMSAFTDPDRESVFECPEFFQLPIEGRSGESRWILYGAQNRYYLGHFDGQTFTKESGPHGTQHGAFYAAQTFSDIPDGRRIQIGWVRTESYEQLFPDQMVNQAFTLPHTMTLHSTSEGLRIRFNPVKESESLRAELLKEAENISLEEANTFLQTCQDQLTEVLIELDSPGKHDLTINGISANFEGRDAHIFTDRTFNEVYADQGHTYEIRTRSPDDFTSTTTSLSLEPGNQVRSLKIYRLKSIW